MGGCYSESGGVRLRSFKFIILLFFGFTSACGGSHPTVTRLDAIVTDELRVQRFVMNLVKERSPWIISSDPAQVGIVNWMRFTQGSPVIAPTESTFPVILALALTKMFQNAKIHETDVSGDLYRLVFPTEGSKRFSRQAYWANCGAATDFMVRALEKFRIATRKISLWASKNDGHTLLEIYLPAFKKFVAYDPLYSVYYLDENGVPAGFLDIQSEIADLGFNPHLWRYKAIRVSGNFSPKVEQASDPRLQHYNDTDYANTVYKYYFRFVVIRHQDVTSTPGASLYPDDPIVRGRWIVFSNSSLTEYDEAWENEVLEALLKEHDVRRNGRYYMAIYRLVNTLVDFPIPQPVSQGF